MTLKNSFYTTDLTNIFICSKMKSNEEKHMKRLLITVLGLMLLNASIFAKSPDLPNIVIILADDMGYGDVSCNNPDSKIQTPNIDRIAAEGIRFTDAHAGGNYCIPSRYALMTGRFATRESMKLNHPLIEDERMTIASLLKDNGYATAMVGKWHLGFDRNPRWDIDYSKPFTGGPVDCGFDTFFGIHASTDIPPYFYIDGRSPVMPPTNNIPGNNSTGGPEGWNRIQGAFWRAGKIAPDLKLPEVTPRFFKEAVNVIQSHNKKKKDKPLFLYLALPSPHTPWLPLKEFQGRSGAGMYGDFVVQVDTGVGRVMKALEAAGMEKDTLILLSSDNGPVWYDRNSQKFGHRATGKLRGMKFSSYEGGHRMPFVVRWPGKIAPESVSGQTIAFSDLFATLAELVGQKKIPEGMAEDSVSFLPYLLDTDRTPEKRAPIIHDKNTIRDGDWKLILSKKKKKAKQSPSGQLYNLREDLSEQRNLILKNPEIANRLKEQLEAFLGKGR